MISLKKVFKNSLLYSFSSILLRASSIIFFPIFSAYLTKTDYGILSMSQSIGAIVTVFAGLELTRALTRMIYNKNSNDSKYQDSLVSTLLLTSLIVSSVIVALLAIFGGWILKPILKDIPFYPYIFVFLLSIPFAIMVNVCKAYLMATHQGFKVFILDVAFFGTNILLNLILVVIFKMNILGVILGILINAIFFGLLLIPLFYRKFTFNFDKTIFKSAMEYSLALLPNVFAGIALESIDKFFLNSYAGADNSGLYYIAITFAAIFSATKEAIVGAFTPWLFGNIADGDESYLSKVISTIYIGLGIIALFLSWFSKEVLLILSSNPDLVNSYKYIPINVLALFIIFLGQLYGLKILFYTRYVKYLVFTILVGIVVDIIACYFLVPVYGIHGAALSRVIAFFFHVMAILYLSHMEVEKRDIYNHKLLLSTLVVVTVLIGLPVFFASYEHIFTVKIMVSIFILMVALAFLERNFNLRALYLTLYKKYIG